MVAGGMGVGVGDSVQGRRTAAGDSAWSADSVRPAAGGAQAVLGFGIVFSFLFFQLQIFSSMLAKHFSSCSQLPLEWEFGALPN